MNLDLLDEVREKARIKAEALKRRVQYKYNYKLRPRQFQVADLVMRKAHPYQLENKLSPKWIVLEYMALNERGGGELFKGGF